MSDWKEEDQSLSQDSFFEFEIDWSSNESWFFFYMCNKINSGMFLAGI